MKRVKMILIKTTTHRIDRVLSDDEIEQIRASSNPGAAASLYATDENIIDGGFELDEFEVIEE